MKNNSAYDVTLVTPMYNEADKIESNIQKIVKSLQSLNLKWEYILINDG